MPGKFGAGETHPPWVEYPPGMPFHIIEYRRPVRGLVLVAVLLLGGCSKQEPLYTEQLFVFGTLVEFSIWGAESEQAREAVSAVAADFQRMHRDWHAWKPGALTELNRALAAGEPAEADPFVLPLIEESKELYRRSEGLFNPAIGRLIALWGFHSDDRPTGPPPSQKTIADLVARHPTMNDIDVQANRVRSRNPAVQLDFGAFAKGYAIDLAVRRLREQGIDHAIVNAGGDLRAIGRRGERPWRVGIRHPQGRGVLASVETDGDDSVFTSGNYERYREHEGVRHSHIIDPRSGMPVEHVASVTVIHDNGAVADAAATALTVAGPKAWHRIAQAMGIKYAMLVDGEGTVYMNPAMAGRIRFEGGDPPEIVFGELL